ncbi:hypothetical protein K525DRAFT_210456 [Schizophyllum commune Loenen D]|nr:hypothetical protein K525DRAFT_210456 [Schizophyllum commune Loenen D]
MPELPEVHTWLRRLCDFIFKNYIKKRLPWPKGTHILVYLRRGLIEANNLEGVIQIYPVTFALGTKQKPYTSVPSVDNQEYLASEIAARETALLPAEMVSQYTASRSRKQVWEYLLRKLEPGEIHVARRNKQLAIAAGPHCISFRFGLEGHLMKFTRHDFDEIILMDVPGPNKNKAKAARLRSFKVPKRFCEALSSPTDERTVNIFAALVLDDWVWAVVDFARLVQMHIISIGRHFVKEDLEVNSAIWPRVWAGFQTGPDWLIEYPLVINALGLWRDEVRTRRLHTPLVDALCDPSILPFNAFGRHTANDLAHGMGVHPNTPISAFVRDDAVFSQFTHSLRTYLAQFDNQQFLRSMVPLPRSNNPFAFNASAHDVYVNRYIHTFRKATVRVSAALYNYQLENGLQDEDHTIGQPYHRKISKDELAIGFKELKVIYYHKPYDSFTTILAKMPDDWTQLAMGDYRPVIGPIRDVRTSGYQTAIGVADFRENKLNMRDVKRSVAALSVPGRKGKAKTSGGRPTRTPTVATLRRELAQMENINEQCRVAVEEDTDSDEEEDEDEEDDYGNEDEIEIANMEYVPKEEDKLVPHNFVDICTPVPMFPGDNQAQPIAKSARTAPRFLATSSLVAESSTSSIRRSARTTALKGGEKRSASPQRSGKYVFHVS